MNGFEKVEAGDRIQHTRVFSITPYSSVGTIDEFKKFVDDVIDCAESVEDGRISIDVRKDRQGRTMQVDFVVEGIMELDEGMAQFHNSVNEQEYRAQLEKDRQKVQEIYERNPEIVSNIVGK